MELRVAKELLHIQRWLDVVSSIVDGGKAAYDRDLVAQEAGDSLMIKIGEASKYLAASGIVPPAGVNWSDAAKNREILAHHYSTVDRDLTWQTLSVSLREWRIALARIFAEAKEVIDADTSPTAPPA